MSTATTERTETDEAVARRERIQEECAERSRAMRLVEEHTRSIAALCKEAKDAGVSMADLARWVTVPKGDEDRSVSRQAIDQMIKAHFGAAPQEGEATVIDLSAFQ